MQKTKEEWMDLINEQRESNMSIKAFCQEKHISQCTFYQAKKMICEESASSDMFIPVAICDDTVSFTIDGRSITCRKEDLALILGAVL